MLIDDDGKIIDIVPIIEFEPSTIKKYNGALVPGFINAHCHLELSHLKNKFPEKTGLPEFLMQVTKQRNAVQEEINNAINEAEIEMINNGIVAVGDISNNENTFFQKSKQNLYYHTFIELFGFNPANANTSFEGGVELFKIAKAKGISASLVPHATYSISGKLIELITDHCFENKTPTSIHMLESNDENEFYMQGTGLYRKLYRELGADINHFIPTGKTALESLLPYFNNKVTTLMVHNTIATELDIQWAEQLHSNLFWCFCPNANLFIEDRIPDIPQLMKSMHHITIGTDSLASNHQLSVLEELKTIQYKFPEIKTDALFKWATLNGAKFLGIEDRFGSLEVRKSPGINLINNMTNGDSLLNASVRRIF